MFNPEGGQDTSVLTLIATHGTHLARETETQKIQGGRPLALTTTERQPTVGNCSMRTVGGYFQKALSASLSSSHLTENAVSSSKTADWFTQYSEAG